jgi:hypothetical protein
MKIASINDILATRSRAVFSHRINFSRITYDNLNLMREWCHDNCQGIWRCESNHAIYFQFELDTDATMFMLRWGGAKGNELM